MRCLQSLCLLRVHSLGLVQNALDIPLIPATLAKELKIMNLMNKTYSSWLFERDILGSRVRQTGLSIQYDGVDWSFQYCGNVFDVLCCPHCDFIAPDVGHLTMEEGKPEIVNSHFSKTLKFGFKDSMMTLEFEMNEDGTLGEISFEGCEELFCTYPGVIRPKIKVEINEGGQREVNCFWTSRMSLSLQLTETSVPVQELLSTPAVSFCMSEVMPESDVNISHEFHFYELDDLIAMMDVATEARNELEPEDFVEDFWKIVPSE